MSIRRGDWYENPDPEQFSLYLENPFETHLNASKNVKPRLVELIRDKSRLALDKMSQADFSTPREYSWGIPLLFHVEEDNHSRISSILHIISDDDNLANLTGVDDSEHRHHDVTGVNSNQNDHVTSHVTGSDEITAESQGHDAIEAGGRIIGSLEETLESLPKSSEGSSSARSTQVWKRLHLSNFYVKLWVIWKKINIWSHDSQIMKIVCRKGIFPKLTQFTFWPNWVTHIALMLIVSISI